MELTREQVFEDIQAAFGHLPRPEVIGNPTHCCECYEHEETMQSVTPETVSMKEVGSPAWDPVCFITDEAYHYFMPGFARLACGRGEEYYLDQFLFHIESRRYSSFNMQQRKAVLNLLRFLYYDMADEIDAMNNLIEIERTMNVLANPPNDVSDEL